MKLHTSIGAPNPRRVNMFLLEKGITHIERQNYDLNAGEHRSAKFTAMNPIAREYNGRVRRRASAGGPCHHVRPAG